MHVSLDPRDALTLDVMKCFHLIDWRCAHEVLEYKCGTRYSVVFYTMEGYKGADAGVKQVLTDAG